LTKLLMSMLDYPSTNYNLDNEDNPFTGAMVGDWVLPDEVCFTTSTNPCPS